MKAASKKAAAKKSAAKKTVAKKTVAKKTSARKPTEILVQQPGQPDILYVEEPGGGFGAQSYTRGHPLTFPHEGALHHSFGIRLTATEIPVLAERNASAKYPVLHPDTKWHAIITQLRPVDRGARPAIEAKLVARRLRLSEQIQKWLHAGNATPDMRLRVAVVLTKAFDDASALDRMARKMQFTGWFRQRFLESLETGEQAWRWAVSVAMLPENKKANRELQKAKAQEKSIAAMLWTREFREALRDGWIAGVALVKFSRQINAMVKRGGADAIVYLGQTIRDHSKKPLKRSNEAWILRAWLPLALWQRECDIDEASDRLQTAHTLMSKSKFFKVRPFPERVKTDPLRDAFERVRKSIKAGKR